MAVFTRKLLFGVTLFIAAVLLFVLHVIKIPVDLHLPYESEGRPSYIHVDASEQLSVSTWLLCGYILHRSNNWCCQ